MTDPANAQPDPPHKRHGVAIAFGATLALGLLAGSAVFAVVQTGNLHDERAHSANLTKSLASTKADLADSEDALAAAESTISDQETRLAACAEVVKASDHQYEAISSLLDAAGDMADDYWLLATYDLNVANRHVKASNRIMDTLGASDWADFWGMCSSDAESL